MEEKQKREEVERLLTIYYKRIQLEMQRFANEILIVAFDKK